MDGHSLARATPRSAHPRSFLFALALAATAMSDVHPQRLPALMIPRPFYLAVVAFATPLSLLSAQVARDTSHASPIVVTATRTPLSIVRSPATISAYHCDSLRREYIASGVDL